MSTPFRDLHVLLAGCGSIGKRHARILSELGVGRIAVCDPDPTQIATLCTLTPGVHPCGSFRAGLDAKPDAAFILTPPKLHVPMAQEAILAGCHVFLEKPVSDTMDGVAEMSLLARESRRKAMVGLCFRYHKGLLRAKQLLDHGTIGRLVSVRALVGEHLPEVRPDYRNLFSAQYSGAFDLMHDIDLALWYAGQRVREVHAVFGTFSDIGIQAPDLVEILMRFEDRCAATVHLDFFQRPRRRQIELMGVDGTIVVEFAHWDRYTLSAYTAARGEWETVNEETARDDMFRDEDREFLTAIVEDRAIVCTIEEAAKALEVVVGAQSRPG